MTCPLCRHRFARDEAPAACARCPMTLGCHLTRCPQCGYEWAPESHLVNWIAVRWRAFRPPATLEESHADTRRS